MTVEKYEEPPSKQSLRVWLKLLKANATIERTLRKNLRESHSSTLPRFDVMSALARHPQGLKMSEVSDLLRVSNGNITAIVDRLEKEGLVQREPSPGDRRAIQINLTETGQKAFDTQASAHEAWVNELLSGLGTVNLVSFGKMLETLNSHLESSGSNK